jgi:hypothetical protein
MPYQQVANVQGTRASAAAAHVLTLLLVQVVLRSEGSLQKCSTASSIRWVAWPVAELGGRVVFACFEECQPDT